MALRIGGGKPAMPSISEALLPEDEEALPIEEMAPEAMPEEDLMAELPESLDEEPMAEGGGEVDPLIAGYKGPENGPFACGNCVYFGRHGENTCAIVSGPIDAEGICNMFTSAAGAEAGMPEEEAPLPEEEITPEPAPEEIPEEMA